MDREREYLGKIMFEDDQERLQQILDEVREIDRSLAERAGPIG